MRAVLQAGQPTGGKAVSPLLGGMPGNPHLRGDVDVPRSLRCPQHDPGALRRLLAARPRPDPSPQLPSFFDRQHDRRRTPTHPVTPCSTRSRPSQEVCNDDALTVETQRDAPLVVVLATLVALLGSWLLAGAVVLTAFAP